MTTTKATAAPKCRICHKEHWLREGCDLKSFQAEESADDAVDMLPLMDDAIRRLLELEAQIAVLTDRVNKLTANSEQLTVSKLESVSSKVVSNGTDRKAYMRELMRKKRAEAKQ
jgi:hypothetical protein